MRILSMVGVLIAVLVIGFAAAMYFTRMTAPMTGIPEIQTPDGVIAGGAGAAAGNVIDTARAVVSADKTRQQGIQEQMDKLDGIGGNP